MDLDPAAVLASAAPGLLVIDRDGVFQYANPSAATMLGRSAAEIMGTSCRRWTIRAADGAALSADELPALEVLRTGREGAIEHAFQRPDGAWRVFAHAARPLLAPSGALGGAVVSLSDVTASARDAELRRRGEAELRAYVETCADGVTLERKGRVVYANPAMLGMLGRDAGEVVGRPVVEFIHPADRPTILASVQATEEARAVPFHLGRVLHRDGSATEVATVALPVPLGAEHTVLAIAVDQTARNRAERELARSRSLLAAAFDATADGLLIVDLDGHVVAHNARFLEMWRASRGLLGRSADGPMAPELEDREGADGFLRPSEALRATPYAETEDTLALADGRTYERHSRPQRIEGEAVGRVWSYRDVTARRRAEAERERLLAVVDRERELLQTVVDHAPVAIALRRGPDLVYELVNPAFTAMFGDKARLGRPFAAVAPDTEGELGPLLERVLETGEPFHVIDKLLRFRRPPGAEPSDGFFSITYLRVPSRDGPAVLALIVETTEQVRARERLEHLAAVAQRHAAELESIYQSMLDGLVVCDGGGRITYINDAQAELTGLPEVDVRERTIADYARLVGLVDAEGRAMSGEGMPLSRALTGAVVVQEAMTFARGGAPVPVRISAAPIRDDAGRIVGAVSINRDVSKLVELDELKDQFIRVAAHELKTPVAVLKGYADVLLRSKEALPASARGALEAIVRGARRIDAVVHELLDVSLLHLGQMELRREEVDLAALVADATGRAAALATRHSVRVVASEPVFVSGDRRRLEQVVRELLDNAVRFSPSGGDVDVTVGTRGGAAFVSVRDQGVGISSGKQAQIFERFYRPHTDTPFDYGGMGAGLYIAREIMALHGGHLACESEEGQGSTFCFTLPISRQ